MYALSVLQDGRLLNDVIPIRGQEGRITAGSSQQRLLWHTEEAGFEARPDYQGFVCFRNPDAVPTMVACVDWLEFDPASRRVLAQPRFLVAPWGDQSDQRIPVALLIGGDDLPYIRFDPVFTTARTGDQEAEQALAGLTAAVEAALRPLSHAPGDLFFIDNLRVVHGRDSFSPRYDGHDRWLKRVKVARDLRSSRHLRAGAGERTVFLEQLYG